MKNPKLIVNIVIVLVLAASLITAVIIAAMQKKQLDEAKKKLDALESELAALKQSGETAADPAESAKDPQTFKYLAIGNSITIHGKCSYWWNNIGMAASAPDKDYFSLVTKELEKKYEKVESTAMGFAIWETQAHDRAQTFATLDPYLSGDLDLITLQLSENASDLTTFERDFEELIGHIREKCPDAELVIVDDFWSDEKSQIKSRTAKKLSVDFADLGRIRGVKSYQSEIGALVYGDDGIQHIVDHEGVAAHPGDKGMKYIAEAIVELVGD